MPADPRPFLTLRTQAGSIRCLRPKLRPLALGLSGQAGGVAQDQPTHTIPVPLALGTPPPDLADNAVVTVDVEPGQWQAFRILRNGIDKGAGVWTLYVRPEEGYVQAAPHAQPAPDAGYQP